jgi:DnaK suppressor protein
MEPEQIREHLSDERTRLADIRSGYGEEQLNSESHGDRQPELSARSQHQADIGTVLERIEAELDDVEHALRRLDDGTYGTCEACGQPIGDERLEAIPAARFCVHDQAQATSRFN